MIESNVLAGDYPEQPARRGEFGYRLRICYRCPL